MAIADFNRDGKSDFVVSNGYDNTLYVYFGHDDGTFDLPRIIYLAGQSPLQVNTADLRGIGRNDLIVAEADSNAVGVLLDNGDGTFATESDYSIPGDPNALVAGDFNGDGKLDVAVAFTDPTFSTSSIIAMLPGTGTGTMGAAVVSTYSLPVVHTATIFSITAGDVNNDGKLDVLVSEEDGSTGARAYLNDGQGHFANQAGFDGNNALSGLTGSTLSAIPGHPGCLGAIDNNTVGWVRFYQGACNGAFSYLSSVATGDVGSSVALKDLTRDGNLDLVTSAWYGWVQPQYGWTGGNLLSVAAGNGNGTYGAARVFRGELSPIGVAFGDLNGDGAIDIVTANQDSDSVTVYLNDGSGNFGDPQGLAVGQANVTTNAIVNQAFNSFEDVNGDGAPDITFLAYTSGTRISIVTLLNDGHGHFGSPIRSDLVPTNPILGSAVLADFRGVGRKDFLAVGREDSFGGQFIVYARSNGDGTYQPATVTNQSYASGRVAIGDFNGDGKIDFVTAYDSPIRLTLFLSLGGGAFAIGNSVIVNGTSGRLIDNILAGDFNRDGKLDVLVRSSYNVVMPDGTQSDPTYEELFEALGNTATLLTPRSLGIGIGHVELADLNHDGWPDLIEISSNFYQQPARIRTRIGQADGSFPVANTYTPYTGIMRNFPIAGDLNGDGNVDILVFQTMGTLSGSDVYAQILSGNGDGSFTPTYDILALKKPLATPQYAVDLNGDGRADVVEIDGLNSSFHVMTGQTAPALQLYLIGTPVIGSSGRGRVSLNTAAAGDTAVQLSASDAGITLPSSVVVPNGQATADFTYSFGASFDATHVFQLSAQLGSDVATASSWKPGPSAPPMGFNAIFDPTSFADTYSAGSVLTGTVYLNVVGGYSTIVQLSCDVSALPAGTTCQMDSSSSVLNGVNTSVHFTVTLAGGTCTGSCAFQVVADDGQLHYSKNYPLTLAASPPTVTTNQASSQPDPTAQGPIHFTVVFSEAVTGFSASGVVVAGTATFATPAVVVTGSGNTYDVAIGGMNGVGTVTAAVSAGVATSTASGMQNQSSTSTDNVVSYVIKKRRGQVTTSQ